MSNTSSDTSTALRHPANGWYARFWRWHFFAAFLVIPFVFWQSVTGILYIWHQEYEVAVHADQMVVAPQTTRVSYQVQLDTALQHQPNARLSQVVIGNEPTAATQVFFTTANGLTYPAFVNPYTGEYLGDIAPVRWLAGITRSLHGGWPLGSWGSYLLELGDGWALVMLLTGVYLWWPRNHKGWGGVLYPRLSLGGRMWWRDLHAVVAIWLSAIVLVFLITALPWTTFWGDNVLKPIERALHQTSPAQSFFGGGHHGQHIAPAVNERAPLDVLVNQARGDGATGDLVIRVRNNSPVVNLRDAHAHAQDETYFQFDAASGELLSKAGWSEFSPIPKLVALGVELHEGSLFGLTNKIVNTLMSLGLIWLSISGVVMWYQRRPGKRGLATPPRRTLVWTRGLKVTAFGVCIFMPLLGLSVLCINVLDRVFGRRLPA